MNSKLELNITWLYPKEMSTYGDRGNVVTLVKRAFWRDISVKVDEIGLKESIRKDWTDIYFFGGGQDQSQILVANDLAKYKKDFLISEAGNDKVFFGVCGGYQLFGHFYKDNQGQEIQGIGILDVTTIAGKERMMGNILVEPTFIKEKLVGFENHSGKTYLGKKAVAFGKVLVGKGNNGEDRLEGAIQNNVYGCYLHGPVLPKNPTLADYFLKLALQNKYGDLTLKFLNDNDEKLAHEIAVYRTLKTH